MPNISPALHPVFTYFKDHEPVSCLARFDLGERVKDHEGHTGVVQALYGAGPVFQKVMVHFDMGVTCIAHDVELEPLEIH